MTDKMTDDNAQGSPDIELERKMRAQAEMDEVEIQSLACVDGLRGLLGEPVVLPSKPPDLGEWDDLVPVSPDRITDQAYLAYLKE